MSDTKVYAAEFLLCLLHFARTPAPRSPPSARPAAQSLRLTVACVGQCQRLRLTVISCRAMVFVCLVAVRPGKFECCQATAAIRCKDACIASEPFKVTIAVTRWYAFCCSYDRCTVLPSPGAQIPA